MTDPTGDDFLDAYTGPRPLRGDPLVAQRDGRCVICGGRIRRGEQYIWSSEHSRGAHVGCGTVRARRAGR